MEATEELESPVERQELEVHQMVFPEALDKPPSKSVLNNDLPTPSNSNGLRVTNVLITN